MCSGLLIVMYANAISIRKFINITVIIIMLKDKSIEIKCYYVNY